MATIPATPPTRVRIAWREVIATATVCTLAVVGTWAALTLATPVQEDTCTAALTAYAQEVTDDLDRHTFFYYVGFSFNEDYTALVADRYAELATIQVSQCDN